MQLLDSLLANVTHLAWVCCHNPVGPFKYTMMTSVNVQYNVLQVGQHYLAAKWGQRLMTLSDFIDQHLLAAAPNSTEAGT